VIPFLVNQEKCDTIALKRLAIIILDIEGGEKPACVAEVPLRVYP